MELYRAEKLSFAYPDQTSCALQDISFTLHSGEFVTLCGLSGSGKSTLLRQMKSALAPAGRRAGALFFTGQPLDTVSQREQAARIGFVQQNVENQLVTDKVWHELAFGPESLGYDTATIRRRVAEMAAFFGLEDLFHRDVASLSGGQKQLLNLAAVLTLQPDVLLLDEPTAQLDPIAAADLLAALGRVNRELGTAILLSEQRLEEALPLSDRALILDGGKLLFDGTPRDAGAQLRHAGHDLFCAMPAAMRVWAAVGSDAPCPVSVREGRQWLDAFAAVQPLQRLPDCPPQATQTEITAALSEIHFKYDEAAPDVLRGLSLAVHRGEFLALLGGNGAGKSTTLRTLAGLCKPYRGTVRLQGKVALLPQEVQTLFARKTVAEDLREVSGDEEALAQVISLCRLERLLQRHPYDLSGGEQQRAALAKILLTKPDILLLDEATKGLDAAFKADLAEILRTLCARGVSVVLVSHDVEFCAEYAARCALLFDGSILADGTPRAFFSGNRFYTTAANRMARRLLPEAVTVSEVIAACGAEPPQKKAPQAPPEDASSDRCAPEDAPATAKTHSRISPRAAVSAAVSLALIPITLLLGLHFLGARGHYILSLLLVGEMMLPFFFLFEGRRPAARELVLLAVLCALGVAGRAAFFMLPQCKPVLALSVLTGAALGSERGFLVGALTMLVSNLMFSQGPWTPWQMFGMGLCGFLAGVFFRKGRLPRRCGILSLFGALSALLVYGPLLNSSSALLAMGTLRWESLLAYCASGFPMDCVHAAASFAFLWFLSVPMLEKLERVKKKYGIAE